MRCSAQEVGEGARTSCSLRRSCRRSAGRILQSGCRSSASPGCCWRWRARLSSCNCRWSRSCTARGGAAKARGQHQLRRRVRCRLATVSTRGQGRLTSLSESQLARLRGVCQHVWCRPAPRGCEALAWVLRGQGRRAAGVHRVALRVGAGSRLFRHVGSCGSEGGGCVCVRAPRPLARRVLDFIIHSPEGLWQFGKFVQAVKLSGWGWD